MPHHGARVTHVLYLSTLYVQLIVMKNTDGRALPSWTCSGRWMEVKQRYYLTILKKPYLLQYGKDRRRSGRFVGVQGQTLTIVAGTKTACKA